MTNPEEDAEHEPEAGDFAHHFDLDNLPDDYDIEGLVQELRQIIAADDTEGQEPDSFDRATTLDIIGRLFLKRYTQTYATPDLEQAIDAARQAVGIVVDDSHHALHLNTLAIILGTKYSHSGEISDLDEAIHNIRHATEISPDDHPDLAGFYNNLGVRLTIRYSKTGSADDINEAIDVAKRGFDAAKPKHDQDVCLNTLGIALFDRYSTTGNMADLDRAVHLARTAAGLTSEDDPNLAMHLDRLAIGLRQRYLKTGATADLEDAINASGRAVDTTAPISDIERSRFCHNHGVGVFERFKSTGAVADLNDAIDLLRQAIDMDSAPLGSRLEHANYLASLGDALSLRHMSTQALSDLDEAIRFAKQAVDMTPHDDLERRWRLHKLACLLHPLSSRNSNAAHLTDADEAIRLCRAAATATPETHPHRAIFLYSLGRFLLHRRAPGDHEAAIGNLQSALCNPCGPVNVRIESAIEIMEDVLDWEQAYEVSRLAVTLIPMLVPRWLGNTDKQRLLHQLTSLASDATALTLITDKDPFTALELLEQGRVVLGASIQDMRVDMNDLRAAYPDVASRFLRLRKQLDQPEPPLALGGLLIDDQPGLVPVVAPGDQRYKTGKELESLIKEIRELPNFENFLGPLAEPKTIMGAASRGPIVVINISEFRCDALLVESNRIRSLELIGLSFDDIQHRAEGGDLGAPEVLEWLWDTIASPVLETLGFTATPTVDSYTEWPHIWWIPTGSLSRFPLHAAGYHRKQASETVLDRVVSSYSSSIKAILHGRQRPHHSRWDPGSSRALLVAMERTTGHKPLPFAKKEIAIVRDICKSMKVDTAEPGRQKEDIVTNLASCTIFHFAGHGRTEGLDPSQSSLCLAGGDTNPLRVKDLLDLNLHQNPPFLAYLSACGTGRIRNMRFMDESIHLISACQLAGFRHVIGTLWDVDDELCVDMARITYEEMKVQRIADESVCLGLHRASRELRDKWLDASSTDEAKNKTRKRSTVATRMVKEQWNRNHGRGGRLVRSGEQEKKRVRRRRLLSRIDRETTGVQPNQSQMTTRSTARSSQRNYGSSGRKVFLCDSDDDDESVLPLHWVPYVHFGV